MQIEENKTTVLHTVDINVLDKGSTHIIQNKYKLEGVITKGTFGIIFKGIHLKTQKPVAIKMEVDHIQTLRHETRVIQFLYKRGVRKIPDILWYGVFREKPCIVMKYYEMSLFELAERLPPKVEGDKLYMILYQILRQILGIMQHIHNCEVVHRDIKPQNFMFHGGEIYLIDFGLAAFLQPVVNGSLLPHLNTTIIGTPKFASIYIHRGQPYSYIDDIVSIGYMMIWLELGGFAPWEPTITERGQQSYSDSIYISDPINQTRLKNKENIATFCGDPRLARFVYDHSTTNAREILYDF